MKEITLKDGFKIELDDTALDDYELLEDLADIDAGKGVKVISAVSRLFGDQVDMIKDHLRNEKGKVTTTAMTEVVMEVITGLSKKS